MTNLLLKKMINILFSFNLKDLNEMCFVKKIYYASTYIQ